MSPSAGDYRPRDAEHAVLYGVIGEHLDPFFERLVPFSCKGQGFCPSCGGRRMTECAARLVDEVLPRVPGVGVPALQ